MSYWLIAIPNEADPSQTIERLNMNTVRRNLSINHEISLPAGLKVGTLDSLMALSEELAKADTQCEQIAKKIARAYQDIHKTDKQEKDAAAAASSSSSSSNKSSSSAASEQVPELSILFQGTHFTPKQYVESFQWDEMRYNKRTPLKQLSDGIVKDAVKADDMLRKMQSDFNEVRGQFSAIERVENGTLLVRPLSRYVKPGDLVTGREYLDTLLIVVPRARQQEFVDTYAILEELAEKAEAIRKKEQAAQLEKQHQEAKAASDAKAAAAPKPKQAAAAAPAAASSAAAATPSPAPAASSSSSSSSAASASIAPAKEEEKKEKKMTCRAVVPNSAKLLCDQAGEEYVLYRVVVLKPGAEHYKNLLREKRYTLRPYKHEPEEDIKRNDSKNELKKQKTKLYQFLLQWCTTEYSESFSRWLHLKFIRLFVEAVLRYGLPVNFRSILIDPMRGKEKMLRATLLQLYSKLAGENSNLTAALDPSETDPSGLGEDFYPYVYLPVNTLD